jgi:hypothetical protein
MTIKKILKPFIPVGVLNLRDRYNAVRERDLDHKQTEARREKLEHLRGYVSTTVEAIRRLAPQDCSNLKFLEETFIPFLGLNDEILEEQPSELSEYLGKGLHLWQYPNQLARYLLWIMENAKGIDSYMEIGCRWGGMFILTTEWLRKHGAHIQTVIAVDPIEPSPFIEQYFGILEKEKISGVNPLKTFYLCEFSTSEKVKMLVDEMKPKFVFIDGDHQLKGALSDHMLIRDYANVIVHHDITSQACPEVARLWEILRKLERGTFDFWEFRDQYESVPGNFLGIGVMKRKAEART